MKYSWCALIALVFCSCGDKEQAGTTSETENEVAMRLVMPDGSAARSARVWLIDAEHYDANIARGEDSRLDSATTDSNGNVVLAYRGDSVRVSVLAQKPGYAAFRSDLQRFQGVVTMDPAGQIQGNADAALGTRVILDGTGISAVVNADGTFTLNDVPQGYFGILVQEQGRDAIFSSAVKVDSTRQSLEIPGTEGFLLENFDDGDSLPLIAALGAGGKWYVYDEGAGTRIAMAVSDTQAWRGYSLGLQIDLAANTADAYGSLACRLGREDGTGRVDLSDLDSLSFWLKGSGRIRIAFASDYIHTQYASTQAYADLGYKLQVPTEWTRISIPVDSLLAPVDSEPWSDGVRWSDVADAIDLLVIGSWDDSGQTVEFSVDDIRFHGVSHTSFR